MCAAKVDTKQVEELVALASAETPPTDPAACWVRDGQGSLEELAAPLVAIEAAVRISNGAVLAHAQANIEDKKLGKALRSALHRLRSTGVEIPEVDSASSWSLGASVAQVPDPVGLIALPEPDGYFPFLLVTYGASGAIIFAGTAGAGMGYRDTEHIHVSRSRAREVLEHAARGEILHQVPFHAALHYTEKAFSQAARRPDDWNHLVDNVAPAVLNSARMLDPLMRESTERDRRILERSE
ncbi:MAG: hypothetical protein QGG40_12640, partial [Myxococcota bacterium]|nr:hypothetical protein [Myxococcota bacterium]